MALGVLGVSVWALWEQVQFAGAATTADYRVTAGFSSMHTGGGHFEAYLVMSLPFVWGLSFMLRRPLQRALLAAIFLLGAYALFATVARGGAIALGVALAVLTIGTWLAQRGEPRQRPGQRARFAVPIVIGLLTVALMIAGASGVFWQQRIAQTAADADIRLRHWAGVLDLREAGWATTLFGQGLGTLPETTLMSRLPDQAGSYRYANDGGNTTLALNSAGTLYLAQRVAPRPAQTLTVQMKARARSNNAGLEASLCEKNLFNSRRCQWLKLDVQPGTTNWQTFQKALPSGEVGAGNLFTRRPVQFSLYNPVPGAIIEVDDIRLLDGTGQDLLKNGDFSRGGDFWFFNSGDHLFWHAKNLWVHLLFEQGWLGLLAFNLILVLAAVRLVRSARRGGLEATVWLAALAAAATVGLVDSLVDAPRLALLVYGVMFVGAAWGASPQTEAAAASPMTQDNPHGNHIHRHRSIAPRSGALAALRSGLG
jgi:O-antigen ligase